jgi:hypothetical protein
VTTSPLPRLPPIGRLVQVTDDEGHSIKHLKRDMVMATLFAESEAFALANRPETKVKIRSKVRPPRWAMKR